MTYGVEENLLRFHEGATILVARLPIWEGAAGVTLRKEKERKESILLQTGPCTAGGQKEYL